MSQSYFDFRQFRVCHGASSMPVGTDAVLLGCWADLRGACRVLDIGTGCGVVALMAAQRAGRALVDGIDIDAPSVEQARRNAQASPFASRVRVLQADVREFSLSCGQYDHVLCNPPFFVNDVLPPGVRRMRARNASALPACRLLDAVARLLCDDGVFSVVLPSQSQAAFVGQALERGLCLARSLHVRTVLRKPPKRVLLEFARHRVPQPSCGEILLQSDDGSRSPDYARLTRDFYL